MEETKYGLPLECYECRINKYINKIDLPPEELTKYQAEQYERLAKAPKDISAETFVNLLKEKYEEIYEPIDYTEIKKHYNSLLLKDFSAYEQIVHSTNDPLRSAIDLALSGNYIDFIALDNVDEDTLRELLKNRKHLIDEKVYFEFKQELENAKTLLYLTDNCGEIVLDKLLIKVLKETYPFLKITAMVRGAEVANDASMIDAHEISLDEVCEVIDNGISSAGTYLNKMPNDKRKIVESADIIISKGQGNAESLLGTGLNIYYLFLCKCERFARLFNSKLMNGVLHKER